MDEISEFASGVESARTRDGDRRDLAVEVTEEKPERVQLGDADDRGAGWDLDIEQARDLLYALQQAIDTAEFNRRNLYR